MPSLMSAWFSGLMYPKDGRVLNPRKWKKNGDKRQRMRRDPRKINMVNSVVAICLKSNFFFYHNYTKPF